MNFYFRYQELTVLITARPVVEWLWCIWVRIRVQISQLATGNPDVMDSFVEYGKNKARKGTGWAHPSPYAMPKI